MPVQIAFLRGINVGGRNAVAMADLREMVAGLGFTGAKTLLQSGNLVFTAASKSASALEKLLEQETEKRFGVAADYVIRSEKELAQVVAANPFPKEAKADPSHLVVMFLKSAASAKDVRCRKRSKDGKSSAARANISTSPTPTASARRNSPTSSSRKRSAHAAPPATGIPSLSSLI